VGIGVHSILTPGRQNANCRVNATAVQNAIRQQPSQPLNQAPHVFGGVVNILKNGRQSVHGWTCAMDAASALGAERNSNSR